MASPSVKELHRMLPGHCCMFKKTYNLGNGYLFGIAYPRIPWIGVMALGYCMGRLYDGDYSTDKRKKILLSLGGINLFVALRYANGYGDPKAWSVQPTLVGAIMSFFNLEKYPPSLLCLAATLGTGLLLPAWMEGKNLTDGKQSPF
jgi:uncharacterized membrane protein